MALFLLDLIGSHYRIDTKTCGAAKKITAKCTKIYFSAVFAGSLLSSQSFVLIQLCELCVFCGIHK